MSNTLLRIPMPSSEMCATSSGQFVAFITTDRLNKPLITGSSPSPAANTFDETKLSIVGVTRLVDKGELATKLRLKHCGPASDLDLIAAAWQRWGRDCPRYLMGDFAFLLWDPVARQVFGARDPLGIKPFFYDRQDGLFIAASTLADLLARHPKAPGLDGRAITNFLTRPQNLDSWVSLRQNIATLPPGYSLSLTAGEFHLARYSRLEDVADVRFAKEEDYDDALLAELKRAVHESLGSDELIGTHLSGGLDSSTIALLAAQDRPKDLLHAYCWQAIPSPAERQTADQRIISKIANHGHMLLRPCPPTEDDVLAYLAFDPCNSSVTSTLLHENAVQESAQRDGVRVILSGWGGDQGATFAEPPCGGAGARSLLFLKLLRRWQMWRLRAIANSIHRRIVGHGQNNTATGVGYASDYLSAEQKRLWPVLSTPQEPPCCSRESQICQLSNSGLEERISSWAWSGARRSIQYRYPFLDIRLVRFALGVPHDLYRAEPFERQYARRAFSRILPAQAAAYRDKRDLSRASVHRRAVAGALRRLLPQLGTAALERRHYVDIARLHADTERFLETGSGPVGLILRAFSFLNISCSESKGALS